MRPDLIAVGAALLIVVLPGTWRPARHVITIVHEAGHALTAILVGRRLQAIRLHSDTSGLTVSRGKPYGPGMVCTTLAGYLAPSVLGLVFATLLKAGLITGLLVVCALLLIGVLIMIRNLYGAVTLLVACAVVAAVSLLAAKNVQEFAAHLITWFLLLGAIRPIAELIRKRRRIRTSDPDQLARLTSTPAIFWIGSFALISTGALILAGGWLLA